MASELGQQLHQVLGWDGPLTHRQAWAWREYLSWQDMQPDLHDYYAMQIAREVACVLSSDPSKIEFPGRFLLTPRTPEVVPSSARGAARKAGATPDYGPGWMQRWEEKAAQEDRPSTLTQRQQYQLAVAKSAWGARLGLKPEQIR